MSVETMVTEVILRDSFTPVLRRIAGEQDAYARQTNALRMGSNITLAVGAAMVAVGIKAVEAAGKVAEFHKIVEKVRGKEEADFASKYVNDFDKHSSFKYFDLLDAAKMMELQNVDLKKSFQDVADIAAMSGRPLMDVAKIYDAVSTGRVGLGLSAKGGFAQFGVPVKEIFKAAGKEFSPHNLQNSMSIKEELDAVHKVLVEKNKSGLDTAMATTTLRGARSMVEGATERLLSDMGASELDNVVKGLNNLAGAINAVDSMVKNHPRAMAMLIPAGLGTIGIGAIGLGMAAWRDYQKVLKGVTAMAALEQVGEKAKPAIAKAEETAVGNVGLKYGFLKTMLMKAGTAALGVKEGAVGVTTAMQFGTIAVGLYGVALAGLVFIGYEVVSMFNDMNKASRDFEASSAAVIKAKGQGYDLKANAGQATGFNALPVWKQVGEEVVNGFANTDVFDTTDGGSSALTDAHSRALAKKHGMAPHGVRAQQIQAQKDQAAATAKAMHDAKVEENAARGEAANKYELDPALEYKLSGDERRVALLEAQGASQKQINAAKAIEIRDLNKAADLLAKQAALATDVKKKYDLLNQSEDDRQKAKMLGIDKNGDKRDKLDKAVASIFGGGGLSGDDTMKRAGLTPSFFAAMGKGKPAANPLKAALQQIAKRPIVLNLSLGDKPFAAIKSEIKDDTIGSLLRMLESSNLHGALGGH